MVRRMQKADLDAVADIWLDTNLKAHSFISPRYWRDNAPAVRGMLAEGELYVYEDGAGIRGFVGLDGDYIAGIFVQSGAQSRGIGRQLLDYAKTIRERLVLSVYQKNLRAADFYRREGFQVEGEGMDQATREMEYQMIWNRERRRM